MYNGLLMTFFLCSFSFFLFPASSRFAHICIFSRSDMTDWRWRVRASGGFTSALYERCAALGQVYDVIGRYYVPPSMVAVPCEKLVTCFHIYSRHWNVCDGPFILSFLMCVQVRFCVWSCRWFGRVGGDRLLAMIVMMTMIAVVVMSVLPLK